MHAELREQREAYERSLELEASRRRRNARAPVQRRARREPSLSEIYDTFDDEDSFIVPDTDSSLDSEAEFSEDNLADSAVTPDSGPSAVRRTPIRHQQRVGGATRSRRPSSRTGQQANVPGSSQSPLDSPATMRITRTVPRRTGAIPDATASLVTRLTSAVEGAMSAAAQPRVSSTQRLRNVASRGPSAPHAVGRGPRSGARAAGRSTPTANGHRRVLRKAGASASVPADAIPIGLASPASATASHKKRRLSLEDSDESGTPLVERLARRLCGAGGPAAESETREEDCWNSGNPPRGGRKPTGPRGESGGEEGCGGRKGTGGDVGGAGTDNSEDGSLDGARRRLTAVAMGKAAGGLRGLLGGPKVGDEYTGPRRVRADGTPVAARPAAKTPPRPRAAAVPMSAWQGARSPANGGGAAEGAVKRGAEGAFIDLTSPGPPIALNNADTSVVSRSAVLGAAGTSGKMGAGTTGAKQTPSAPGTCKTGDEAAAVKHNPGARGVLGTAPRRWQRGARHSPLGVGSAAPASKQRVLSRFWGPPAGQAPPGDSCRNPAMPPHPPPTELHVTRGPSPSPTNTWGHSPPPQAPATFPSPPPSSAPSRLQPIVPLPPLPSFAQPQAQPASPAHRSGADVFPSAALQASSTVSSHQAPPQYPHFQAPPPVSNLQAPSVQVDQGRPPMLRAPPRLPPRSLAAELTANGAHGGQDSVVGFEHHEGTPSAAVGTDSAPGDLAAGQPGSMWSRAALPGMVKSGAPGKPSIVIDGGESWAAQGGDWSGADESGAISLRRPGSGAGDARGNGTQRPGRSAPAPQGEGSGGVLDKRTEKELKVTLTPLCKSSIRGLGIVLSRDDFREVCRCAVHSLVKRARQGTALSELQVDVPRAVSSALKARGLQV